VKAGYAHLEAQAGLNERGRKECPAKHGEKGMNNPGKRTLIYTALLLCCALISVLAGPGAGIWSFLQVIAIIEIIGWMGADCEGQSASRR
jgi:hypothetical protein